MNGFVIAVGSYVGPLSKQAIAAAQTIGAVSVNMGDTACKVPLATAEIKKAAASGRVARSEKRSAADVSSAKAAFRGAKQPRHSRSASSAGGAVLRGFPKSSKAAFRGT